MTAAVGRPSATSRANVGPESAAMRARGKRSAITSLIRRGRSGSKPFVALTIGTSSGTGSSRASVAAKNSEGTTMTIRLAPRATAASSPVTSTSAGSSMSARYHGLRRVSRMPATTSGSRAQSRTGVPPRARWTASAVPQLPPPTSAITASRGLAAPLLAEAPFRAGEEPTDVVVVPRDDDRRDGRRGQHRRAGIAEQETAQRHADRGEQGAERHVPERERHEQPDRHRGQHRQRHEPQESAEAGRDPLAAPEEQEHGPAVAGDRGDRARGGRPRLDQRAERDRAVALGGGADVAALVAPDVADAGGARDQEADRHRADQVRGGEREGQAHDQRSPPGTIAR